MIFIRRKFYIIRALKTIGDSVMAKTFAVALLLAVLFIPGTASADEESTDVPYWDWLGVGPIFSYGSFYNPSFAYYPVYAPSQPAPQIYAGPYFYYKPTYAQSWWVGEHRDMEKVLQRARSGSSMRIFSGGMWMAP